MIRRGLGGVDVDNGRGGKIQGWRILSSDDVVQAKIYLSSMKR